MRTGPRRPVSAKRRTSLAPGFRLSALQRLRMFLLGAVAVGGATWALARHLQRTPEPMLVVPPAPTEIPAPDLEPSP